MKKVKLHLNYAGHCFAKEHDVIQGGRKKEIVFHALWGLIQHPDHGLVLFDTGYTDRFYEATKSFPNIIYQWITRVEVKTEDTVKYKLAEFGVKAEDIKHVIISHFHGDHVAGLRDFPNAQFYASRAALTQVASIPKWISFTKGILKDLHPDDLMERMTVIDEGCDNVLDPILGVKFDLFGDDSIWCVPLPGHAAGQMGVLLETDKKPYFLIADACWVRKSFEDLTLPNPIVRLFFHSWSDFKSSLNKVHLFHQQFPNTVIVPTHCSETTDNLVTKIIQFEKL